MAKITTNFQIKEKRMFELYGEKKYAEAYSMIEEMLAEFPGKAGSLYNYAYCIKNLMGDSDAAMGLMEEAASRGYWSDPKQMMEDPDLESLRDNPRFVNVVSKYAEMAEKSRKNRKPDLRILEPETTLGETSGKMPLLIALHGNNQSADDAIEQWKFLAEEGWLVGFPQSSQESMSGAYVWNDFSVAVEELKDHYDRLRSSYDLDEEKTIVAGFSKGGALAAKICLEQIIPCRNFILIGPYIKNPMELEGSIRDFSAGKGSGYILVGEHDTECINGSKQLFKMLQDSGVESRIEVLENLSHEYPPDFRPYAERMIKFIEKGPNL